MEYELSVSGKLRATGLFLRYKGRFWCGGSSR